MNGQEDIIEVKDSSLEGLFFTLLGCFLLGVFIIIIHLLLNSYLATSPTGSRLLFIVSLLPIFSILMLSAVSFALSGLRTLLGERGAVFEFRQQNVVIWKRTLLLTRISRRYAFKDFRSIEISQDCVRGFLSSGIVFPLKLRAKDTLVTVYVFNNNTEAIEFAQRMGRLLQLPIEGSSMDNSRVSGLKGSSPER